MFSGTPLVVRVMPAESPIWTAMPLPYLTVGDVLYGLHRGLRSSVEQREFDGLERGTRERLRQAFERRLAREGPQNYDRNLSHGVRRVDYLGDLRGFMGIRPAKSHEVPPGVPFEEAFVVITEPLRR